MGSYIVCLACLGFSAAYGMIGHSTESSIFFIGYAITMTIILEGRRKEKCDD